MLPLRIQVNYLCTYRFMTVQTYFEKVPKQFLDFIDEKKNCEDIAMAHMVTQQVTDPKD